MAMKKIGTKSVTRGTSSPSATGTKPVATASSKNIKTANNTTKRTATPNKR